MASFLHIDGLTPPGKRFAFTNISKVPFTSYWAKNPIVVQPGETIELSDLTPIPGAGMGYTLMEKMTTELVDRIMIGEVEIDELAASDPAYKPGKGAMSSGLGVPSQRKIWEDKISQALGDEEDSAGIRAIRQQLKDELTGVSQREEVGPSSPLDNAPSSVEEFASIKGKDEVLSSEEKPKKAVRTKKINKEE